VRVLAQSVFGCFLQLALTRSAFIYVIKKKVLCDKKDDIQWVQQIICPRVPKKRINFFADRMDDIHGNNKKGGGGKRKFLQQDG
jgi:hypothetical protein